MKRQHTMGAGSSSANPKQRRAKSQKFRKSSSTPLRRGTNSVSPGPCIPFVPESRTFYIMNLIIKQKLIKVINQLFAVKLE